MLIPFQRIAETAQRSRLLRASFLLPILTLALLLWSWHQWASVLGDTGYNLYTAWKLTEGQLLYRDLGYFHGPLSPYLYAFFFRLFGTSLEGVVWGNTLLLLALAFGMHYVLTRAFGSREAWAASLFFLIAMAFGQYGVEGSFNFAFPYKPEANHGLCAMVLGLAALALYLDRRRKLLLFAFGFCWGLALLTTLEIAGTVLLTLFAISLFVRIAGLLSRKELAAAYASLALPLLGSILFFLPKLGLAEAFQATFRALLFPLQNRALARTPYYAITAGLDDPLARLKAQGLALLALAFLLLLLALLDRWAPKAWRASAGAALGALFWIAGSLAFGSSFYLNYSYAVPGALLLLLLCLSKENLHARNPKTLLFQLSWALFSLFLLAKVLLHPDTARYGFFLAMPAVIFCIAGGMAAWPRLTERLTGSSSATRSGLLALVALLALLLFKDSSRIFSQKEFLFGRGKDAIATFGLPLTDQGVLMEQAREWIERNTSPQATLLVLPEGRIFNFLTRRASVGPFTMNPVEWISLGEEQITAPWRAELPDMLAFLSRDSSLFGFGYLNEDPRYGAGFYSWLLEHYEAAAQIGGSPFDPSRFGIRFYRKKVP